MPQTFSRLKETPSQTVGPYVHVGATPNSAGIAGVYQHDLGTLPLSPDVKGKRIIIAGRIVDGSGVSVKDAIIETWQADSNGIYPGTGDHRGDADPYFRGWMRQAVDSGTGLYRFETIKPGKVPYLSGHFMAPHVTFWITARGINTGLHTRLYFPDEHDTNSVDPILASIENPIRSLTLISQKSYTDLVPTYTFDIHLQGECETAFFDI